ncbi:MAG: hypothetical protein ACUVQ0_06670 [Thermoproteota archaeon]
MKPRFRKCSVILLIMLLMASQMLAVNVNAQAGEFIVDVKDNTVEIAYVEMGFEKFRLIINKNGGLDQLIISQVPFTSVAGCYVFGVWEQTWNTDPVRDPVIEKKDYCVEVRFYGMYRNIEVYTQTNYTISKTGLIFISNVMEASVDLPELRSTSWMIYFPAEFFSNEKAYVRMGNGATEEVVLPPETTSGNFLGTDEVVHWVDFSKRTDGVTVVNMAPGSDMYYSFLFRDERQWGYHNVYGVWFIHRPDGQSAMVRGEKRFSKIALYIHGSGGYSQYEETLKLIVDLASTRVECEKTLAKYERGSNAWQLAQQAITAVDNGLNEMIKGDFARAKAELENANSLRLKTKETGGELFEILIPTVSIIVIILVVVILIWKRKGRTKTS